MSLSLTALLCPLVQPVSCDCDSKVGVREYVMWNIMCGSKPVCVHVRMYVDWGERGGVCVEVLDLNK